MNEIKEVLAILKASWLEASVIIGLWFLYNLLNRISRIHPGFRVLVSLVAMSIFIFIAIVSVGFLRTVYLEQDKRQSLRNLMRIGKHFFWRFFGFAMLCGLTMMPFVGLLRTIIIDAVSDETFPLANQIGFTIITLIFAKLVLLIPAIIIVLDRSLFKSFGIMWKIKLLRAKPLLIIFLMMLVLPYLLLLFPNFRVAKPAITWVYALPRLYFTLLSILPLMVQIMAVKFVSSLGLNYNEPINRQNFSS